MQPKTKKILYIKKKKLKQQTPVSTKFGPSPRSTTAVQLEPERLRMKGFVEQMSFKSGIKAARVIDGESEGGDCDEVM